MIVIAILAVLATVAVVLINPTEILKQTRDSRRLSELQALNQALQVAQSQISSLYFGSSSVVYVSIPDTSSACVNLNLPSLPTGWSYSCKTLVDFRKVNGNGWIPVNFSSLAIGSPFSALPIDPINNATSSQYYTYVTGGSWQLNSRLESLKFVDKAARDGGNDPALLEIGNNLTLAPFTHGLVGYWKFDEISGDTSTDSSGFGRNGSVLVGVSTVQWTSGKVGGALNFDGADDYVNNGNFNKTLQQLTVAAWVKTSVFTSSYSRVVSVWSPGFILAVTNSGLIRIYLWDDAEDFLTGSIAVNNNVWYYIAATWNIDGTIKLYVDGNIDASKTGSLVNSAINTTGPLLISFDNASAIFNGLIDDIRIYNRVLSASEIKAMYDATK